MGISNITICKDEYRNRDEFEDAIKRAIMVLLENNYIMTVKYDDKGLGIVTIDFNPADETYGCDYPYWLSAEESEMIYTNRIDKISNRNEE